MKDRQVNIKLPEDLWRRVGMIAAMEGLTKKQYVADMLTMAVNKDYNGGASGASLAP